MLLDASNPVLRDFALACSVLCLKMFVMSLLTARHRLGKGIFITAEDGIFSPKKSDKKEDDDIERVRRAHRNDMENIPPFFILGLLYLLTDPTAIAARILYFGFTAARIMHTVTYLNVMQPHRFVCFGVAVVINVYMAFCVIATLGQEQ